jgi:putative transposase
MPVPRSLPKSIFYLALRGDSRRPLFSSEKARDALSELVAEALHGFPAHVHAFCWTDNEARLAVQVARSRLQEFIERMDELHVLRLHDKLCTGECPFATCRWVPIEGHAELLDLVRHIHLAPVKAGLAEDPASYRWSSDRAYLGLEEVPWLTTSVVSSMLGSGRERIR